MAGESEMVNRVARAICKAEQGEWREPPYNNLHTDSLNNLYRHKALAAIEAMDLRNPELVHINMLRGTIGTPTIAQFVHIHGVENVLAWLGHPALSKPQT